MKYRILGAILLAALLLRLTFYHGFTATDDNSYHFHADRLAWGEYRITDPQMDLKGLRFGLLLPLAGLESILPAPVASGVLTIGASLGSIVLVFLLGTRLFSERAGLAAAALFALAPLEVQMSTTLFPEVLVTLAMLGSLLLFLRGSNLSAAASGALAALALTIKENAFYWLPFFAWWAWRERLRPRAWVSAAGAFALGVLGLLGMYAAATGDPFYQIRVIDREYGGELAGAWYPTAGAVLRRIFLEVPSLLFNPMEVSTASFGFYFVLAFPAFGVVRRDRGARTAAALGGLLLFMFNFFPARWIPYVPNTALHRYLYPLLVPAVLLLGAAAVARPRWSLRGAVPFVAFEVLCSWILQADTRAANSNVREAVRFLKDSPERVFTDGRTGPAMRFYLGRRHDIRPLPGDSPQSGDLVFANFQYLRRNLEWYGDAIPAVFSDPPPGWRRVAEFIPRLRGSLRRGSGGWGEAPQVRGVIYRVE